MYIYIYIYLFIPYTKKKSWNCVCHRKKLSCYNFAMSLIELEWWNYSRCNRWTCELSRLAVVLVLVVAR